MEDRIPTPGQEGRVLITPEDGGDPYYATVTMADNPTNPGTPLNKETLLQDKTETSLFGNANNRTVDDAFQGIAGMLKLIMGDQAAMTLKVQASNGNGIRGVLINNLFDESGGPVYTDETGTATGYVAEGSVTLSISGYADIENYSETIEVTKGETYSKTWTVNARNFIKITSTQNVKFSGNVQRVDISVVGGGGGAGGGIWLRDSIQGASGGAGGGGFVTNQESVPFSANTTYTATIGAGGSAGDSADGSKGGTTTFLGVSAEGGNPGTKAFGEYVSPSQQVRPGTGGNGNGNGANGVWGDATGGSSGRDSNGLSGGGGTIPAYSSFTETSPLGGGGGSGASSGSFSSVGGAGGQVGGGSGGDAGYSDVRNGGNGTNGTGGGGGSGSACELMDSIYIGDSGRGGSGCVAIRMHLISAA